MPFVSPVTVKVVAAEPVRTGVCALAPMYGVMRYPVIGLPPFELGAVQLRLTEALPAVPVTFVGAPGKPVVPVRPATTTWSKSVVSGPSFQSWRRWRFVERV